MKPGAIETSSESLVSPKHIGRNEDDIVGDVRRLEAELAHPPKMETEPLMVARDNRAIKESLEKESAVADKLKELRVYGVLDGVSGHTANGSGLLASRIGSAVIAETMAQLPPEADAETAKMHIRKALEAADMAMLEYKSRDGRDQKGADLQEMSSTADLVKIVDRGDGTHEMAYGHTGDGRIYVWRQDTGKLERITVDHGLAGAYYLAGKSKDGLGSIKQSEGITKQEYDAVMDAEKETDLPEGRLRFLFQNRNAVFSSLGRAPGDLLVDSGTVTLNRGDKVLISTDGIHDNLKDSEIEAMLKDGASMQDIAKAAANLAAAGTGRSKEDDTSGVLIEAGRQENAPGQIESTKDLIGAWRRGVADGAAQVAELERLRALASPIKNISGGAGSKPSRGPVSPEDKARIEANGGLEGIESLQRRWKIYMLECQENILRQEVGEEMLEQIDKISREAEENEKMAVTVESAKESAKHAENAKTARRALEHIINDIPSAKELRGVQAEIRKLRSERAKEDEDGRAEAERRARKDLE